MKRLAIRTILQLTGNYREMHGLVVNGKANPLCADSCIRLEKLMDKAVERCPVSHGQSHGSRGERRLLGSVL